MSDEQDQGQQPQGQQPEGRQPEAGNVAMNSDDRGNLTGRGDGGPNWLGWKNFNWRTLSWAALAVVAVAVVIALSAVQRPAPRTTPAPARTGWTAIQPKRFDVIAFYVPGKTPPSGSFESFKAAVAGRHIDYVEPLWFSAYPDGTVKGSPEKAVLDLAKRSGVKVIPIVSNAKVGGGEREQRQANDQFLHNPKTRAKAINTLVQMVDRYKLDGINVDFQLIDPTARHDLTAFVRELAAQLHPKRKEVHMDVIPPADVSAALNGAFDYKSLARYADRIILMTYDQHAGEGTPPGPVASLPWVDKNLKTALRYIPREKLSLGMASYGYDWPLGKAAGEVKELSSHEAVRTARVFGVPIKRNKDLVPHYTYTSAGITRQAWWEDHVSAARKLDIALKNNVRGIAVWRLGYENAQFWPTISSRLGRK